jgi:predicted anti-sigma-YlaC factor YlaD
MMGCKPYRARLHDWLDTPSPASLPPELAEHVRACEYCRVLVKRWNAIEVQMLTMRNESPQISPDFRESLAARLEAPAPRFTIRMPYVNRRYALALASAIILIIVVAFSVMFHPAGRSKSDALMANNRGQTNSFDQHMGNIPSTR